MRLGFGIRRLLLSPKRERPSLMCRGARSGRTALVQAGRRVAVASADERDSCVPTTSATAPA